jgi:homoserine kinase type II
MADLDAVVRRAYGIDTDRLTLVGRSINDTYRVEARDTSFALRVYRAVRPWAPTEDDIGFELDLLEHLAAAGLSVPRPVHRLDGTCLGRLTVEGISRPYALFTWMPGHHVDTDRLTPRHVAATGEALAAIHTLARSLQSTHPRPEITEEALITRPLTRLAAALRSADRQLAATVERGIDDVRQQLSALQRTGEGWGIVHGDPQVLNFLFDNDHQATVIDFDHCGHGWLTYDVAYYWSRLPATLRDDFLDSYHHQRPLTATDLDLLPLLARAAWIRECTDSGDGLPVTALATLLRDPRL